MLRWRMGVLGIGMRRRFELVDDVRRRDGRSFGGEAATAEASGTREGWSLLAFNRCRSRARAGYGVAVLKCARDAARQTGTSQAKVGGKG